jgi:hypothetical protein
VTQPSTETLEREKDKLYLLDSELIRRLGVPEKIGRAVLATFDREKHRGFPQKQKLWGGRRYWPAVKAFLDRSSGLTLDASPQRKNNHG